MPGPQVKDWELYHKLIEENGYSKETAAKIANAAYEKRTNKKGRKDAGKR